jgi:hypothetical protein
MRHSALRSRDFANVCALMNVSLLIAAGAYYFFLDEKVTKTDRRELMNTYKNRQQVNKSRQKKASPTGLYLWPAFLSGRRSFTTTPARTSLSTPKNAA